MQAPPVARLSTDDIALVAALVEAADMRRADTSVVDRALGSASSFVRAYAARTVGQNGISTRAAVLRGLLTDGDTAVAADAAFALGLLRDTAAASGLANALTRSATVVEAAAWSLGELGSAGRPPLERVLATGEPRAALALVLQASAKLRPVPAALIVPYFGHADTEVRRSAVYAVTRSRVPASARALLALATRLANAPGIPATDGASVDLRSYVARGLGLTIAGDSLQTESLMALQQLANDPHPHVRINAVRALATYGALARDALMPHVRDADANVRIALAQSLGDVLGNVASDWRVAWAADTGFTYRRSLLPAALRVGVRLAALDPASDESWLRHRNWRYRAAVAQAAGAGTVADLDAIASPMLRDPDPRVRTAAYAVALPWADSATSLAKPYGRAALSAALGDVDLFVRASILDAMRPRARAGDASVALRAWRAAASDPENDARVAALRVIASAWTRDSAAFTTAFRDSLAALPPPLDPIERSVGRNIRLLQHWPAFTDRAAHAPSWYADQVRAFVLPALAGRPTRATVVTERGTIQLQFYGADAPLTVANFLALVRRGYYNGLAFHRVVPNFVAQDGDPRGDGSGGPGYAIRDELNRRWYDRGAVGMALSGPDTGGSQYFLTHSPQPHLDGHYTVFAHVMTGLDVLDAIVQGDRISSVTVQ